jgi:hypothetical protein
LVTSCRLARRAAGFSSRSAVPRAPVSLDERPTESRRHWTAIQSRRTGLTPHDRWLAFASSPPRTPNRKAARSADVCAAAGAGAEQLSGADTRKQSIVVGISPPAAIAPQSLARQQASATLAAGCASVDASLPRTVAWTDLGIYRRLLLTTRSSAGTMSHS